MELNKNKKLIFFDCFDYDTNIISRFDVKYQLYSRNNEKIVNIVLVTDSKQHLKLPQEKLVWDDSKEKVISIGDELSCFFFDWRNKHVKTDGDTVNNTGFDNKFSKNKFVIKMTPINEKCSIDELNILKYMMNVENNILKNDDEYETYCIKLLGCFVTDSYVCQIVPYFENGDMRMLLMNDKFVFNCEKHLKQLLTSIYFLHTHCNIVHADLRPQNIFVDKCNNLYVCDFDNASFLNDETAYLTNTVPYRSPEILMSLEWDNSCDIWSIGCILYEIITKKTLFRENNVINHIKEIEAITKTKIPHYMLHSSHEKLISKYLNSDKNEHNYGYKYRDFVYKMSLYGNKLTNDIIMMCLDIDPRSRKKIGDLLFFLSLETNE